MSEFNRLSLVLVMCAFAWPPASFAPGGEEQQHRITKLQNSLIETIST